MPQNLRILNIGHIFLKHAVAPRTCIQTRALAFVTPNSSQGFVSELLQRLDAQRQLWQTVIQCRHDDALDAHFMRLPGLRANQHILCRKQGQGGAVATRSALQWTRSGVPSDTLLRPGALHGGDSVEDPSSSEVCC